MLKIMKKKGRWYLGTTKTVGSCREVYICNTLHLVLSEYKKLQNEYKKDYGKKYKQYVLEEVRNKYDKLIEYRVVKNNSRCNRVEMVFTRKDGTYSGTDIVRYPFRIIHYELGISCRFYDLRGSFATISLRNGCEIKDIAEVLGHRRTETTEKYYISSTNKDKEKVSRIFEMNIKIKDKMI
jgi:integrase